MIVRTSRPVLYNSNSENYFSLDASSTTDSILAFQKWANSKGQKIVDENGVWNPTTSKIYNIVKKRYELETGDQIGKLKPNYTSSEAVADANAILKEIIPMKPSTSLTTPAKPKANWWQKKTKSQKNIIMIGGIIVIVGFFMYKSSSKK